jgi:hypothetical protein
VPYVYGNYRKGVYFFDYDGLDLPSILPQTCADHMRAKYSGAIIYQSMDDYNAIAPVAVVLEPVDNTMPQELYFGYGKVSLNLASRIKASLSSTMATLLGCHEKHIPYLSVRDGSLGIVNNKQFTTLAPHTEGRQVLLQSLAVYGHRQSYALWVANDIMTNPGSWLRAENLRMSAAYRVQEASQEHGGDI